MELQSRAASIVTDARALQGRCDGASCALMKRKRDEAADSHSVLDSLRGEFYDLQGHRQAALDELARLKEERDRLVGEKYHTQADFRRTHEQAAREKSEQQRLVIELRAEIEQLRLEKDSLVNLLVSQKHTLAKMEERKDNLATLVETLSTQVEVFDPKAVVHDPSNPWEIQPSRLKQLAAPSPDASMEEDLLSVSKGDAAASALSNLWAWTVTAPPTLPSFLTGIKHGPTRRGGSLEQVGEELETPEMPKAVIRRCSTIDCSPTEKSKRDVDKETKETDSFPTIEEAATPDTHRPSTSPSTSPGEPTKGKKKKGFASFFGSLGKTLGKAGLTSGGDRAEDSSQRLSPLAASASPSSALEDTASSGRRSEGAEGQASGRSISPFGGLFPSPKGKRSH
ncbi:unnamed protein product [Vitrella brassicaformis CCMP3155]|uniref:Uncharacterized protein n=2 Tax=Vitrella brassicaformis TaxID=1169539 RepID=A0A0G4GSE7_VITBC|nr:unnamed protein product [Vitrella brassicaformis CCMP3155]|eukprot:CEM33371.1 unnamed protein product [Vitrella brassicaformis CCMP3155]